MSTVGLVEIFRNSFDLDGSSTNVPLETFKSIEVKVMFINLALTSISNSKYAIKRFLETKKAKREIRTLVISGVHASSLSEHFGVVLKFMAASSALQTVIFENIDGILPSHMKRLSAALIYSSSVLWFCMRRCSLGDNGFAALVPSLVTRPLQVIVLESCALTDRSIGGIDAIIKGHEARMDTLAWGALLRYPAQDIQQLQKDRQRHSQLLVSNDPGNVLNARADAAQVLDRMAEVHASGLVAINLKGNLLTSTCAVRLAAGLSSNRWLLGLNLSRNRLDSVGVTSLATMLTLNKTLRVLVMEGNPGLESQNRAMVSTLLNGRPVLPYRLSDAVALLLDRWKQLITARNNTTSTYANATPRSNQLKLQTKASLTNHMHATSETPLIRRDSTAPSGNSCCERVESHARWRVISGQASGNCQGDELLQPQNTASINIPRNINCILGSENEQRATIENPNKQQNSFVKYASTRVPTLCGHPLLAKTIRQQQQSQSLSLSHSQKAYHHVPSAVSSTDRASTSPFSNRSQSQSQTSFKDASLINPLNEIDISRTRHDSAIRFNGNVKAITTSRNIMDRKDDTANVVLEGTESGLPDAAIVVSNGDVDPGLILQIARSLAGVSEALESLCRSVSITQSISISLHSQSNSQSRSFTQTSATNTPHKTSEKITHLNDNANAMFE